MQPCRQGSKHIDFEAGSVRQPGLYPTASAAPHSAIEKSSGTSGTFGTFVRFVRLRPGTDGTGTLRSVPSVRSDVPSVRVLLQPEVINTAQLNRADEIATGGALRRAVECFPLRLGALPCVLTVGWVGRIEGVSDPL